MENKNLKTNDSKTVESKVDNEKKVRNTSPTWKIVSIASAALGVATVTGVTALATSLSTERKHQILNKELSKAKIDIIDKESKTKAQVLSISDFKSNINTKLYTLLVETDDLTKEVNKYALDDKNPYTTFRAKFALAWKSNNKITSDWKMFEFRNLVPPRTKQQLNEYGKIDNTNWKTKNVDLVLDPSFDPSKHLAHDIEEKVDGKYKYFDIVLKQNNNENVQYEIVDINVKANDEKSEAIFSYKLKVKTIDDPNYISDTLEYKINTFAKTSAELTTLINNTEFEYQDANNTYVQNAIATNIVSKTALDPNLEIKVNSLVKDFANRKCKARIQLRSLDTNLMSNEKEIELTGFFDDRKQINDALGAISFNYNDKENTYASEAKKINLTHSGLDSIAKKDDIEVIYTGYELKQEDESNPAKRTNLLVSYKLRNNVTKFESTNQVKTISNFKQYLISSELNKYLDANKDSIFTVNAKNDTEINNISNFSDFNISALDSKYQIDASNFTIIKNNDEVSLDLNYRISEKNGKPGIYSNFYRTRITGFKMPKSLVDKLAREVQIDAIGKASKMAYEYWDNLTTTDYSIVKDARVNINIKSVKQTSGNQISVKYTVVDAAKGTESAEVTKTISDFKTSDANEKDFSYEVIEYEGNKAAFLNGRKTKEVFVVPAKIGNYKVIKCGTLFHNIPATPNLRGYGVILEEGIKEVSNLIMNTESKEFAQILAVKLPKSIEKINNLIVGKSSNLAYLKMYDNVKEINGLFTGFKNNIAKEDHYRMNFPDDYYITFYTPILAHQFGEFFKYWTADSGVQGRGSFKFDLVESGEAKTIKLNTSYINNYSFLESIDGKKLYKIIHNKEAIKTIDIELKYENISQNAFSGLDTETIDFWAPNLKINNLPKGWFLLDNLANLKNLKFSHHKMEEIPFKNLMDGIHTLNNLELPNFKNDNGENVLENSSNKLAASTVNIKLPENTKSIGIFMEQFKTVTNLTSLTKLKLLKDEAFTYLRDTTLDFRNCPIEEIQQQAFWWSTENVTIYLPKNIKKVSKFILYGFVEDSKYSLLRNDDVTEQAKVKLTRLLNVKLVIKESQRPATWSPYFMAQYSSSSTTSTGVAGECVIEWVA